MNLERAIEILKQSKNVQDWNEKREFIKLQMDELTWLTHYMPTIDASGLIVEILGKD